MIPTAVSQVRLVNVMRLRNVGCLPLLHTFHNNMHGTRTSTRSLSTARHVSGSLRRSTISMQTTYPSTYQRRTLYIQMEATPNDNSLKFKPGCSVMKDGQSHEFITKEEGRASPLAKALFDVEGVETVFFGPDFITVSKDSGSSWQLIRPSIYAAITDFFASGQPLFNSGSTDNSQGRRRDTEILPEDSETVAMIKELLETRIRPAIQEDGGDIEYRGFDDGVVKLKLQGACRTCDSSTVTLKRGIENMLMHYVPEIQAVEQVLDEFEKVGNEEFTKLENKLNDSKL